ncbi:hypothetical protein [Thauera sp. 2A1]|uniref:hypothetical protein n=1 Tax=Thauera sp. 2A1 TaxID=2570191 RepID=UPI00129212F5|nr:hypothetical protein [Thauera sp. 2A1]KAI5914625.1 hypothetical protein GH664_11810 [Thauera sp. 2A1]
MSKDELQALFPGPVPVSVAGRDLEVGPLTLGELPALLAVLRESATSLGAGFDPVALVVEHPDLAIRLIAVLTRQDADWLKGLSLDEAAALLVAAIEANESFFVRNGRALVAAMQRAVMAAGGLPLPASSSADTASPT